MTALTLPGTIPGLLRRGSPAFRLALGDASRQEAILVHAIAERPQLYGGDGSELCAEIRSGPLVWWPTRCLALDLTDPTGRAHAAWWLNDHDEDALAQATRAVSGVDDGEAWRWLIVSATSGDAWPDARVEYLRLVCLHVAGVPS